jgi:hypothetical protein
MSPHGSGRKPPQLKDVDILFHTVQLKCECGRLLGDVKRADKRVPAKGFDWIPSGEITEVPAPEGTVLRMKCPACSNRTGRPVTRWIPKAEVEAKLSEMYLLGDPKKASLTVT